MTAREGQQSSMRAVWDRLSEQGRLDRTAVRLLTVIAVILVFYAIQTASLVLVPITLAWLLSTLFHPLVDFGRRFNFPSTASAFLIVALVVGSLGGLVSLLMEPASQWVKDLPALVEELKVKLLPLEGPLSQLEEVSREVGEIAGGGEDADEAIKVKVEDGNIPRDIFLDAAPIALMYTAVIVFLTFFMLASGDGTLRKMTRLGRDLGQRRRIVRAVLAIRQEVARYLATVTIINCVLGFAVFVAMSLLDVPNPLLWGAVAGVLNFAPYVGPAITIVVLTLVGISSFDTLGQAAMPPLVFLILTSLEGQLVMPMVVGRRLALSPAVVFVSVLFWGWIWGVIGALMAVPIVASLKIIFENIPALRPIAKLLERE